MALLPVNAPAPRQKKDPLDRILQGLQMAQSGFGIAVDISKLKSLSQERGVAEQKAPLELASLEEKTKTDRMGRQLIEGKIAGGITGSEALERGLIPDEKGTILMPTFQEGGLLVPKSYSQKHGLDDLLKQTTIQKNLLDIKGQPVKDKSAQLEMKLKEDQLATPNQNQSVAAGYATRAAQAQSIIDNLTEKGFDRTSLGSGFQSILPNAVQSPQLQQHEQAERNFVSAVLRKESGANIPKNELEQERLKYFPQYGDSPEVVAQKRDARLQAIENLRAEGGKAVGKITNVPATKVEKKSGEGLIKEAKADKPKTVIQNGHTYTLNPKTGKYE